MDKKIKERWVAALRSGEYKQGKGQLVTPDDSGELTYCCLGVLCDLAIKDGVDIDLSYDSNSFVFEDVYGFNEEEDASLPPAVVAWAGVDDADPQVLIDGEREYLARINDGGKNFETGRIYGSHPFPKIADLIEDSL